MKLYNIIKNDVAAILGGINPFIPPPLVYAPEWDDHDHTVNTPIIR